CGAEGTYGLRAVELGNPPVGSEGVTFGRYEPAGRVLLFAQSKPPWLLPGTLPARELERLRRAGAQAELLSGAWTGVAWPGDGLRDFMLHDALLHELGHHVVQQYTGKRAVRMMRTRDHEAFAERFAARVRAVLAVDGLNA